jgi:hypothetical protein
MFHTLGRLLLIALLLPTLLYAGGTASLRVAVTGTAGGGGTWVCSGDSTYPRANFLGNVVLEGSSLTCPGGTITKVRVIVTTGTGSDLKVAIYNADGPPRTLYASTTIAAAPSGNNDWILTTPKTCTTGQTIKVAYSPSDGIYINTGAALSSGFYQVTPYASFPPSDDSGFNGSDYDRAVCIFVTP